MSYVPRPRRRGVVLRALGIGAAVTATVAATVLTQAAPASADTPWGTTGASYRSGVVCALPDGRRVALASWVVDGATAFSTADVVARGATYGAAPRTGAATDLAPGTRGLAAAQLAALAYLIGHPGAGTPTQVAETSALVARSFGGGAAQQACLGRQGTSAAGAAALSQAAQRFAGPYTVQVSGAQARPGSNAPLTATVLSASGAPTPGIEVTFAVGATQAAATTGQDGRATAHMTAPAVATPLVATATAPTDVRLIASSPASVTVGAPRTAVGRASIVPVLHPSPHLTVSGGADTAGAGGLVLAGGTLTPTATVTGSAGYSGTGTIAVVGPVTVPGGGTCSTASFAGAPTVWTGTFAFAGDGPQAAGRTGGLQPGCYAFTGNATTTDSSPAVTVRAAADPATAVGVSSVQLTQTAGSGLARTGSLAVTITAAAATGAQVTSTVTTYGPLPAGTSGRCDMAWTGARVLTRSAPVSLAAQGADRLTATVRTAPVTATGCYALVARSTVTQNGRSAVVSAAPGAPGTTVTVIAPALDVTNSAYDGRQGVPMTGTVRVTGTYGFAGQVAVGLVSAPAPITGCHGITFPATTVAPADSITMPTTGDGDYRFRSPVPSQNRCYGVVATLAMSADTAVRVAAPAPGADAVFLAGAVVRAPADIEVRAAAASAPTRQLVVLGVAGVVVLVIALSLMIAAAVSGERKPDPRAGDLLLEIAEAAPAG